MEVQIRFVAAERVSMYNSNDVSSLVENNSFLAEENIRKEVALKKFTKSAATLLVTTLMTQNLQGLTIHAAGIDPHHDAMDTLNLSHLPLSFKQISTMKQNLLNGLEAYANAASQKTDLQSLREQAQAGLDVFNASIEALSSQEIASIVDLVGKIRLFDPEFPVFSPAGLQTAIYPSNPITQIDWPKMISRIGDLVLDQAKSEQEAKEKAAKEKEEKEKAAKEKAAREAGIQTIQIPVQQQVTYIPPAPVYTPAPAPAPVENPVVSGEFEEENPGQPAGETPLEPTETTFEPADPIAPQAVDPAPTAAAQPAAMDMPAPNPVALPAAVEPTSTIEPATYIAPVSGSSDAGIQLLSTNVQTTAAPEELPPVEEMENEHPQQEAVTQTITTTIEQPVQTSAQIVSEQTPSSSAQAQTPSQTPVQSEQPPVQTPSSPAGFITDSATSNPPAADSSASSSSSSSSSNSEEGKKPDSSSSSSTGNPPIAELPSKPAASSPLAPISGVEELPGEEFEELPSGGGSSTPDGDQPDEKDDPANDEPNIGDAPNDFPQPGDTFKPTDTTGPNVTLPGVPFDSLDGELVYTGPASPGKNDFVSSDLPITNTYVSSIQNSSMISVRKLSKKINYRLKVEKLGTINLLPDYENEKAWKLSSSPYNVPSLWGQCTWFAWARFYELYGFSPRFYGNGYECVDQLLSVHGDKFKRSKRPASGAVFSSDYAHNHVGIVLDYDEEKDLLTIQEANLDGVSNPIWEEAIDDYRTIRLTSKQMRALYGDVTYAIPRSDVKFVTTSSPTKAEKSTSGSISADLKNLKAIAKEKVKDKVFVDFETVYSSKDSQENSEPAQSSGSSKSKENPTVSSQKPKASKEEDLQEGWQAFDPVQD